MRAIVSDRGNDGGTNSTGVVGRRRQQSMSSPMSPSSSPSSSSLEIRSRKDSQYHHHRFHSSSRLKHNSPTNSNNNNNNSTTAKTQYNFNLWLVGIIIIILCVHTYDLSHVHNKLQKVDLDLSAMSTLSSLPSISAWTTASAGLMQQKTRGRSHNQDNVDGGNVVDDTEEDDDNIKHFVMHNIDFDPHWMYKAENDTSRQRTKFDETYRVHVKRPPFAVSDIDKVQCGGHKCVLGMGPKESDPYYREGYLIAKTHYDIPGNATWVVERYMQMYMLADRIAKQFNASTLIDGPPEMIGLDIHPDETNDQSVKDGKGKSNTRGAASSGKLAQDDGSSGADSVPSDLEKFTYELSMFMTGNKTQLPRRVKGIGWTDNLERLGELNLAGCENAASGTCDKAIQLVSPLVIQKVDVVPSPTMKTQYLFDEPEIDNLRVYLRFLDKLWPESGPQPDKETLFAFVQNLRDGLSTLREVFEEYLCLYHDMQWMIGPTGRVHQIDLDRCWTANPNAPVKEGEKGKKYRRDRYVNSFQKCMTIAAFGKYYPGLSFKTYYNIDEWNTNRTVVVRKRTEEERSKFKKKRGKWYGDDDELFAIQELPGLRPRHYEEDYVDYKFLDGLNTSRAHDCYLI